MVTVLQYSSCTSPAQRELIASLAQRLARVAGVEAVVLGGSHARGQAHADSDIDLCLLYRDAAPLAVAELSALASEVNDHASPVVTGLYEWGPWVNGGAWLTIGGQRVDFLYRSIDHVERVIDAASRGEHAHDYGQQPPFGFYSDTYLGDVQSALALVDPAGTLEGLQRRVATYPEPLRAVVVRDGLAATELDLYMARVAAKRGNAYVAVACLTRVSNRLIHVLFALNRRYFTSDKAALLDLEALEQVPARFGTRLQACLAHAGDSPGALSATVENVAALSRETAALGVGAFTVDDASPAWVQHLKNA